MADEKVVLFKRNTGKVPTSLQPGEIAIDYGGGTEAVYAGSSGGSAAKLPLDGTVDANASSVSAHVADKDNPHQVAKSHIGLENVDNTSDSDKAVSSAMQSALDAKLDVTDICNDHVEDGTDLSKKAWSAAQGYTLAQTIEAYADVDQAVADLTARVVALEDVLV